MTIEDFNAALRREAEQRRAIVRGFVSAMISGTPAQADKAVVAVDHGFLWLEAMRAVGRIEGASPQIRDLMLEHWLDQGDHIRQETGDDLVLVAGLRKILPSYSGPALEVYRGDSWRNRCRRTYGLSWSTRQDVADGFAQSRRGLYRDGSCLLAANAPAEAVVCVPKGASADGFDEAEALIDRRQLRDIRVLKRYPPEGGDAA